MTVTQEQWRNGHMVDGGVDFGMYGRQPFNFSVHLKSKHRFTLCVLCSPHASALRSNFLNILLVSEDIKFYWCIVTADFDVEDTDVHDLLLRMIAELYISIRFYFAGAWISELQLMYIHEYPVTHVQSCYNNILMLMFLFRLQSGHSLKV